MKAPMKKITLLVYHQDKNRITNQLQDFGLVHVETEESITTKETEDLRTKISQFEKAIEIIKKYGHQNRPLSEDSNTSENPYQLAKNILDKQELIKQKELDLNALKKEKSILKPWGNFDCHKIEQLQKHGVYFHFYRSAKKQFYQYDWGSTCCQVINESSKHIYFVIVNRAYSNEYPFELCALPNRSLSELAEAVREVEDGIEAANLYLAAFYKHLHLLIREKGQLEDLLQLEIAANSFGQYAKGKILHLKGWFPENEKDKFVRFLEKEQIPYLIASPSPADQVPVLLRNNSYSRIFESITKIFQLPSYYEPDLTPFIAVFFPIFFAYCLGDAGYGLVLFLAATIARFSFLRHAQNIAYLGILLGALTTITGIIKSGSVFGIPILETQSVPLFSWLSDYVFFPDDQSYFFNAFNVALLIGVFQIFTAVIISIIKKARYESLAAAIAPIGKFFILASVITLFLAEMQGILIFKPYSLIAKAMLVIGAILVIGFHNMQLPVGKRLGNGVLPLFFIFTGILGDTLSYVRLFALGVSSSVLGLVVNQIGIGMMDGFIMTAAGIVFLIAGHSVNFALACLGAFVHPLRLTFVEFYNNAGFEGGGIPYKPFKKASINN